MPLDFPVIDVQPLSNESIAAKLKQLADLLEAQNANAFRIHAYRVAADTVRSMSRSITELLQTEGIVGLLELPGVGRSLARSIERLALTGHLPLLDQLSGQSSPESILATVPGIGPRTAARIHDELGIETLAELEAAAYDGRLAAIPGMGQKKIQAVRDSLAGRFRKAQRSTAPVPAIPTADQPKIDELLSVDEEYRRKAGQDRLLRVAPHRFNRANQAWLPILHTHRDDRQYTVMFSNSVRAHELGTTHDWVVIVRDDHSGDGRWTVITSLFGKLKGHRIVRGREDECEEFYRDQPVNRGTDARQ